MYYLGCLLEDLDYLDINLKHIAYSLFLMFGGSPVDGSRPDLVQSVQLRAAGLARVSSGGHPASLLPPENGTQRPGRLHHAGDPVSWACIIMLI